MSSKLITVEKYNADDKYDNGREILILETTVVVEKCDDIEQKGKTGKYASS